MKHEDVLILCDHLRGGGVTTLPLGIHGLLSNLPYNLAPEPRKDWQILKDTLLRMGIPSTTEQVGSNPVNFRMDWHDVARLVETPSMDWRKG